MEQKDWGIDMEIKTTKEIFDEYCDDTGCGLHNEPDKQWVSIEELLEAFTNKYGKGKKKTEM